MAYERLNVPDNVTREDVNAFMCKVSRSFAGAAGKAKQAATICSYKVDEQAAGEGMIVCAMIAGPMTANQANVLRPYS